MSHISRLRWSRRWQLAVLSGFIFLSILIFQGTRTENSDRLHIALLGPMSGTYQAVGEEMQKGSQLYIDEINQNGGIDGKPVELVVFDDRGDPDWGRQQAQTIVNDDRILLTLGSYFSSISAEAGRIFDAANLPAVTGLANADKVTQENRSYFRTTFTTSNQGILLANYIQKIFNHTSAGIIFDPQDLYSRSLATSFENTFRGLGGTIQNKWEVHKPQGERETLPEEELSNYNQTLEDIIVSLIDSTKRPSVLFLASLAPEASDVLVALKRQGIQLPIVGGAALSERALIDTFERYPEAQAQPGYFSDGMYAASPLIFDIANDTAQEFRNQFLEVYNDNPTEIAALSYDAAKIALEGIQRAGVVGNFSQISQERKAILQALQTIRDPQNAVEGLDGALYFDSDRNTSRILNIGQFRKQEFISAPIQLQPLTVTLEDTEIEEELNKKRIIRVGGEYMDITRVAYTGIDINEISNLNLKDFSYTMDFFLWLRYQGDERIESIEFINAIDKIQLKDPILEQKTENETYRVFRIKANFRGNFDFQNYPFDSQILKIKFRNTQLSRRDVIYVPDLLGMGNTSRAAIFEKFKNNKAIEALDGWKLKNARFHERMVRSYSTLGNPELFERPVGLYYSQFNADIEVERESLGFSLNNLLPLVFFLLILYLFLFFPVHDFSAESIGGILLGVVFFHLGLKDNLPGDLGQIVALDVIFYVVYGLIAAQMLLVLMVSRAEKHQKTSTSIQNIIRCFKIAFPMYLLVALSGIGLKYDLFDISVQNAKASSNQSVELISETPASSKEAEATPESIELSLLSWKPEYLTLMERWLQNFASTQGRVRVQHFSVSYLNYEATLENRFQRDIPTDLIFLRPFNTDRHFFEAGYLQDLSDLPGLRERFSPKALDPWRTESGEIYGVPLAGVAHGIYYNADLFEELNLDIPQTWEDLLTVAQTLKDAGYVPFANPRTTEDPNLAGRIFDVVFPNFVGGEAARNALENGDRCFNDEAIIAAFQAVREIEPFLSNEDDGQGIRSRFSEGETAMMFGDSWEILELEQNDLGFKWSTFAIPAPEGRNPVTVFRPDFAIGISTDSENPEAAREFLQWLTTVEAQQQFAETMPGNFPLIDAQMPLLNPQMQVFQSLVKDRQTDVHWAYPKLLDKEPDGISLVVKAIEAMYNGELTPEEAAESLQWGLAEWYEPAQVCKR